MNYYYYKFLIASTSVGTFHAVKRKIGTYVNIYIRK